MSHFISILFKICVVSFKWIRRIVIFLLHICIYLFSKYIWLFPLLCIVKNLFSINLFIRNS